MSDLLSFSLEREPVWRRILIREVVAEVCDDLAIPLVERGIQVDIDASDQSLVGDAGMLRRAVANLVRNAIDAMPNGGELVITAYQGPYALELEVADSGPGVDDVMLHRIFDPFYSTRPLRAGLGLTVVRSVAEAHGGDVSVANCPEGGAAFTLRLPRRAMEAAA